MEKRCKRCGVLIPQEDVLCCRCGDYNDMQTFRQSIRTNADRIRAMTNRELAAFLIRLTECCATQECEKCPIGCEVDRNGKPFCGDDNIRSWANRKVIT